MFIFLNIKLISISIFNFEFHFLIIINYLPKLSKIHITWHHPKGFIKTIYMLRYKSNSAVQ
jgi:hypothetical protein